jgi:hypothetical protein
MYQIKCECGYEIQVVGKGEKGLCRVVQATSSEHTVRFTGTYAECEKWLADRAVKVLSAK